MNKEEILKQCTIDGNIVKLPAGQLERKLYQEVAKSLELIGGKWKGGKIMGFIFEQDPTELLFKIASGEKKNLKKEFQFFGTPEKTADLLVSMADIENAKTFLEPSAGQGAIIKAIHKVLPDIEVNYCELMDINLLKLQFLPNTHVAGIDFMLLSSKKKFDRIIANPPFNRGQDMIHVKKMYEHLNVNGRLASVMSISWMDGAMKKQVEFRKWLKDVKASITHLERGTFKESGTMIPTVIVTIDKQ